MTDGESGDARHIEFWYEFASTYSYPAAMQIEGVAAAYGVHVIWRPFLLGVVFKAQGMDDSPFNLYPVKGAYMWRDMERICDGAGLTFAKPPVFPANGLKAARLASTDVVRSKVAEFSRAIYVAQFADGKDISDNAVLANVLERLGIDPNLAAGQASDDVARGRLRGNTARAMELGLFGAPSFVTSDGELFWGHDRMAPAVAWEAANGHISGESRGQSGQSTTNLKD